VATEYSVPSPATRNASYNCLPQTLKVMTWNCGHGELNSATMCRFVTRARPRVADDANSSAKSHLPISVAFDNGHYARAIMWEEVKLSGCQLSVNPATIEVIGNETSLAELFPDRSLAASPQSGQPGGRMMLPGGIATAVH
jgi:hypothetical protein